MNASSRHSKPFSVSGQQRRRQFVAPPSVLAQFGANSVLELKHDSDDGNKNENTPATVLGITLQGWKVTTWQGTIANEEWLEQAIQECEACAQPMVQASSSSSSSSTAHDSQDHLHRHRRHRRHRRKLNLPEMVFGSAHVTIEQLQQQEPLHEVNNDVDSVQTKRLQLGWDAKHALMEWARAHEAIPLPSSFETTQTSSTDNDATVADDTGVSILQSMDAALWRQKNASDPSLAVLSSLSLSNDSTSTTVVHFDWTYSTPYCGHVKRLATESTEKDDESGTNKQDFINNVAWKPLVSSGIKLELLTDQSVPILYFDEIFLLEDDLHDNGQVQYSVKLRVMPHCIYILARLWLCVDQVMLRLRETRVLVELNGNASGNHNVHGGAFPKIHRDVTWRQCEWKDLPKYSLPTSLAAWCGDGSASGVSGRGVAPRSGAESPEFQARLTKLPLLSKLPANLSSHSILLLED